MSEQKLVSPLLDGFVMGDPISNHDGVRCCPAMRENSDEKYIVKIISIPPSQKQLDALLLTGAFADAASAMDYFKEQADGVVKEAEILKQLSKLEGFLPYIDWQLVPKDGNDLGYEIYLLSPYKRSLEKHLRRNTMTHLGAVNLALDLCAALSICRRAGYMYVDLKPGNIYLHGDRGYRIGDLGFVNLKSLKYASLPGKYCSSYCPPELHDPLATLNPTADVYAVGMILYQIYNNDQLPFEGHAPAEALDAPMNADYEIAEIIAKAIDPSPRKRWQTPIEMGQALVSYMKRNTINDDPIVPPVAQPELVAPVENTGSEESAEPIPSEMPDLVHQEEPVSDELAFMNEMVSDETAPDADNGEAVEDGEMTDEVSAILAQADELLTPQEEIQSEEQPEEEIPAESAPVQEEIDDFPPIVHNEEIDIDEELDFGSLQDPDGSGKTAVAEYDDDDDDDYDDDDDDEFVAPRQRRKKKNGWVKWVVTLLILALIGVGGFFFYTEYYLLPIENMEITGSRDTITVQLTTEADESLLTVVCTDTYGNASRMGVSGGKAVFTGLSPDTMYKITLEADGFHGLSGAEPCSYTTSDQTKILDFTAETGTEDGSVVLNFSVDGPEQDWIVEYTAEGEEMQSVSFTGHMVSINNLTVGKTYTFKLTAATEDLWIIGEDTLDFTANKIVVAEKLTIVSCVNGVLTAQWTAPADAQVDSWTVRCYADANYDDTITVTDTTVEFTGVDPSNAYTIEVTAAGMSQSARAYVTANPITVSDITVEASKTDDFALNVSWKYEGSAPTGGWLLMYALGNSEAYEVVVCENNNGVIESRIPGSVYNISIQAADGSTIFGGKTSFETAKAKVFNALSIDGSKLQASLCPTPGKSGWTYKDIADDDYRSSFKSTEKASLVIYSPKKAANSKDDVAVMFIIRDSEGNPIPKTCKIKTIKWNTLWNNRTQYCSLDIPTLPTQPGSYTVEVYFNNELITSKPLTITE